MLILAVQLRNLRATARIVGGGRGLGGDYRASIGADRRRLTLFHLVALLLVGGIGTNYALFMGMPRGDRRRPGFDSPLPVTLSVTLAAATTLIAFATLAMSATPVLHMIGVTVAVGATIALVVSMALGPERTRESTTA